MAAQGERELGDIVMGEGLLDPVAQDFPEQEMLVVEEEQIFSPTNGCRARNGCGSGRGCGV